VSLFFPPPVPLPGCAGAELSTSFASTQAVSGGEPWVQLTTAVPAPAGTMSALCRNTLQPVSMATLEFEVQWGVLQVALPLTFE